MQLFVLIPLILLNLINTADAHIGHSYHVKPTYSPFDELHLTPEVVQKMLPFPTVPQNLSRTHRVGAQRYRQFGQRCWDGESCEGCVCCGNCTVDEFMCFSPAGSLDYCLLYEKLTRHAGLEEVNEKVDHSLPADFPDLD